MRVGYNHFISNKGKWNNCFSKFSNRVFLPIFISTILQSVQKENLAHYFPYDVKLGLLAHSRSFLANQKARNAIVGAEDLLNVIIIHQTHYEKSDWSRAFNQFTIACELDMINAISAADIVFIMSSSTSAWLLSPLECSPQKQNG